MYMHATEQTSKSTSEWATIQQRRRKKEREMKKK
jgi:hypothetical protein